MSRESAVPTGVLRPPTGVTGSGVAAGGTTGDVTLVVLASDQGLHGEDLDSAGALCARCGDLVGPYSCGCLPEDEDAGGLHLSHALGHTGAR